MRANLRVRVAAGAAAVVAAAALWLPWWTAPHPTYRVSPGAGADKGTEFRSGAELLGTAAVVLVLVAAVVVLAALASGRAGVWWWVAGAGVVPVTVAVAGGASWGSSAGAVVMALGGLVVSAVALWMLVAHLPGRAKVVPAAVLLLAVPVVFVPDRPRDGVGPFAHLDDRSGAGLVPVDERVADVGGFGVVGGAELRTFADGQTAVLARFTGLSWTALGVVDGRFVVHWPGFADDGTGEVWVARPGMEETPSVVSGIGDVHVMSHRGTVLVTADDTSLPGLRRLDVTRLAPGTRTTVADLPVVTTPAAAGPASEEDGGRYVEHPGTGEVALVEQTAAAARLVVADGPGQEWRPVAGNTRAACGITSSATRSHFATLTPPSPDGTDGWWFGSGTRLLHVAGDGTLREVADAAIGDVAQVRHTGDALVIRSDSGVWRLPDPEAHLVALPAPVADCAAGS